jgi:hypothetical protein
MPKSEISLGADWIRNPGESRSAVVFVHGILSHGETAWTHENGANWPDMVAEEPDMSDVGVCVFSYRADVFARNYSQSDAADFLRESVEIDNLWKKQWLIFVCHSLGGIITRRFLVANQQKLFNHGTNIGLFLIASPSLGSADANRIYFLARMLESTQAQALRFSQQNIWLNDLDKDFMNLKEDSGLTVKGKELVEDEPLSIRTFAGALRKLIGLNEQVVTPESAARYFSHWVKIPTTDHNSIAKPESRKAIQHRILMRFVRETIHHYPSNRPPVKPDSDHAASALKSLKERLQQGKIVEFDALAAVQDALLETRAYLARRAQGSERDSETEYLLSDLWSKAGAAIMPYDPQLANLCYVKGNGWADNDLWQKAEFKDLPISVDEMLTRVLDSTMKASSSARKQEAPEQGDDIVEGVLQVDTRTWRATVLLPPFSAPPEITLARRDGRASAEPVVEDRTPDKFTVRISRNDHAGEWVWRARGKLLRSANTLK